MAMKSLMRPGMGRHLLRSEEHTSELQSRQYLVCRLLLEKTKSRRSIMCRIPSAVVCVSTRRRAVRGGHVLRVDVDGPAPPVSVTSSFVVFFFFLMAAAPANSPLFPLHAALRV